MILRLLLLLPLGVSLANGQFGSEPPPRLDSKVEQESREKEEKAKPAENRPEHAVEKVTPSVKQLDETRFQIGEIVFDQKTREIRFPAVVNMTEGTLEFLLVHKNGKIHESLLATEISPLALNVVLALLRYPVSKELYPLLNPAGESPDSFPEVPEEIRAGARVAIDVEWKEGEQNKRMPTNDWIQHLVKNTAMPAGPWVYGGSEVSNGQFAAQSTGDIIAIYFALSAIINYPGKDHDNDDVWTPFTQRVPPKGTKVSVIIHPYPNAKRSL